ncbi:MAG: heavy-metal-associated domain-containing protein [Betaproteobacteria bacterium]|nr:MAG: heavy-metal-associated domain-containing protein [Betaproteobacteria bacterium]
MQLKIEGLHCDGCVRSVTRMLTAIPGVDRVAEVKRAVERVGFKAP